MNPTPASSFLLPFVILAMACITPVQGAVNKGLIVVNDGSSLKEFSKPLEYASMAYYGETYRVTLANGYEHGGLSAHVLADVSYVEPTEENLKYMEATARTYTYTQPFLKPRILALKNRLANPPPGPQIVPQPSIPFVTEGNRTYKNVRPSKLRNGVFSFFHDTGVFSTAAEPFTLRSLRQLADLNPELKANAEYKQLVETFIPVLYFNDADHTGVKALSISQSEVVLQTDNGVVRFTPDKIPKYAWKQLDEAKERERVMYAEIAARKDAQRRQQAINQALHQPQPPAQAVAPEQSQGEKVGMAVLKGAAVITAVAVVWGLWNKFVRNDDSDGDVAPATYGETSIQPYLTNRWSSWGSDSGEAARNEQASAAKKSDDEYWTNKAIQNNNEWFDKKQEQNLNEYFDRRKETQGF